MLRKYSKILENENAMYKGKNKKTARNRGFRFGGGEESRILSGTDENAVMMGIIVAACCISCCIS
jgi:hypothetical protein